MLRFEFQYIFLSSTLLLFAAPNPIRFFISNHLNKKEVAQFSVLPLSGDICMSSGRDSKVERARSTLFTLTFVFNQTRSVLLHEQIPFKWKMPLRWRCIPKTKTQAQPEACVNNILHTFATQSVANDALIELICSQKF